MSFSSWLSRVGNRALLCLTTIPTTFVGWVIVLAVGAATLVIAGIFASVSGFVNTDADFDPPWRRRDDRWYCHWSFKPLSAFFFPSLAEEFLWRGLFIGHPATSDDQTTTTTVPGGFSSMQLIVAGVSLVVHFLVHPVAAYTCWPRGRLLFGDWRFLVGAFVVLGGATVSYLVSGGSVWTAALTHGLCVAFWRDFFGGEAKLMSGATGIIATTPEAESNQIINVEEREGD